MKKTILITASVIMFLFSACKKDKVEVDLDTQTAQDNSLAEGVFNDINNIANQASSNGSLSTYRLTAEGQEGSLLSTCATVTVRPDSSGTGGSVDVDFGPTACRCTDGRFRKGMLTVYYTGAYRDSGTQIVSTLNNYYVGLDSLNLYKVEGSKTVVNRGHNGNGHLYFTIDVNNARITNPSGATMSWTSSRQREWVAGENTTTIWIDDEYKITGSASGTNFSGTVFTVSITSPLIFSLGCPNIKQGIFELTPANKPTRTFDYGAGTCDPYATVTVSGRTFNIVLR